MNKSALMLFLMVLMAAAAPSLHAQLGPEGELRSMLNEAQARALLGVSNKGAGLSLEQGLELARKARQEALALEPSRSLSQSQIASLRDEADALVAELEVLVELYEERFFGVYPLARLIVPTLLEGEGFELTEQLFHPPDLAAVELAGRALAAKLEPFNHPSIVLISQPHDPKLETAAYDVLLRAGVGFPQSRSALVRTLDPQDLSALDRGASDTELMERVMQAFDTETLVLADIRRTSPEGYELIKFTMSGGVYLRGEAVQGSSVDATPALRVLTVAGVGTVVDRRGMFWLILLIEVGLFLLAMAWAGAINWGLKERLKHSYRLALGAALFVFGRVFIVALIVLLQRYMPEPSAMASSSVWWPAMLGFGTVLVPGIIAWIGQAWLTDIVPGARGARAVGTLFGTTALGAVSYFATPILLMESTAGLLLMTPLVLAALGNAVLFAYAARFGPPVPTGFIWAPLVLAPTTGVVLLQGEPGPMWLLVIVTGGLMVTATVRHRWAVARGLETRDQDHEAAAKHEKEKLDKLREKLKR